MRAVQPPARLAERPYLRPHYDEPEFVVRNIWRLYGGWYGRQPGQPQARAPDAALWRGQAVAELAGGAGRLGEAALEALASGDQRLAGHLGRDGRAAAPDDAALHRRAGRGVRRQGGVGGVADGEGRVHLGGRGVAQGRGDTPA
ncbi:hypothetical protein GCM10018952_57120 [Streptosporangium vulgare]